MKSFTDKKLQIKMGLERIFGKFLMGSAKRRQNSEFLYNLSFESQKCIYFEQLTKNYNSYSLTLLFYYSNFYLPTPNRSFRSILFTNLWNKNVAHEASLKRKTIVCEIFGCQKTKSAPQSFHLGYSPFWLDLICMGVRCTGIDALLFTTHARFVIVIGVIFRDIFQHSQVGNFMKQMIELKNVLLSLSLKK